MIIGNHVADIFADAGIRGYISKPEIREEKEDSNTWNLCEECLRNYEQMDSYDNIIQDIENMKREKNKKVDKRKLDLVK